MTKASKTRTTDKKLTEEQDVSMWLSNIAASEGLRDSYRQTYHWDKFIHEYKCLWDGVLPSEISPYNLIFSWAKTEVASLYLRDPHIEVNPLKRATIEQARIRELSLSDIIRRKKVKREVKKVLLDSLLVGHGWGKVGYAADFNSMIDKEGNQLQSIIKEDFFVYRIPWDQMTFNIDSVNAPFDSRWIAQELFVPLDELKKKGTFKHLDQLAKQTQRLNLSTPQHTLTSTAPDTGYSKHSKKEHFVKHSNTHFVRLYEIWDLSNKEVKYIAPGISQYLLKKKWPYKSMKGFPFSYLVLNPVNDEPYGIPDIFTWHDQLIELIKLDHTIDDHVKKGNRQVALGDDNDILPESIADYEAGTTGAILKFKSVEKHKFTTLPFLNVLNDVYPLRAIRKENIVNTSGQAATERGATESTSTRTFSELALLDRGAKNRRAEKLDVFEDFLEDMFNNISGIQAEFADVAYYVQVTGKLPQEIAQSIMTRPSNQGDGSTNNIINGQLKGFSATKQDLGDTGEEEFDIGIQAGSTVPLDQDAKLQALQLAGEMALKANAQTLLGEIARMFFEQLGMPELNMAIEKEIQNRQAQQAGAAEQQQQAIQFQAAQDAAKTQLNAEREVTRNAEAGIKQQEADTSSRKVNLDFLIKERQAAEKSKPKGKADAK